MFSASASLSNRIRTWRRAGGLTGGGGGRDELRALMFAPSSTVSKELCWADISTPD